MSIYSYLDHTKFICNFLEERKNSFPKWTQRKLANLANIQAPYFSSALKNKVNFTQDQVFRIAHTIKLNEEETDYLCLLSDYQYCSDKIRQDYLLKKIEDIKLKKLRSEDSLNLVAPKENDTFYSKYYSDPLNKIVHVAFSIKRIKDNPKLLTEHLSISEERLLKILDNLEQLKVITVKKGKVEVLKKGFHLPEDHPLIYTHQTLLRQISISQSANFGAIDKYSFSVTFSGEYKNLEQIKSKLLESLSEIKETIIQPAKSKHVFQLNIDLFPWIK